jgi:MFS family permease
LDLKIIGRTAALAGVALPIALLFAGHLVDRWNAVRVNAYLSAMGAFMAFGSWVLIFVTESPPSHLWLYIGVGASFFSAVVSAMSQVVEIPRLVELFPRERFGQFSGAIALLRGPAHMLGGFLAGAFMDLWVRHIFPKEQFGYFGYRFAFLWSAPLALLLGAALRVAGPVHIEPLMLFALHGRMVAQGPEE